MNGIFEILPREKGEEKSEFAGYTECVLFSV